MRGRFVFKEFSSYNILHRLCVMTAHLKHTIWHENETGIDGVLHNALRGSAPRVRILLAVETKSSRNNSLRQKLL